MTSLASELSRLVGQAFAAEGLSESFGQVQASDRPDLAPFQCNGALAAAKATKSNPRAIAEKIATALGYVGVLAVEMFVVPNGKGPQVLVNEIAPRVHNSGHWTLDGASISQFEQHIRAIAGWTLGDPRRHSDCVMQNLVGDDIEDVPAWLARPGVLVHLYGKSEARPGRKMGHVTQIIG